MFCVGLILSTHNTLATGAKLVPHLPGDFVGLFFGTILVAGCVALL